MSGWGFGLTDKRRNPPKAPVSQHWQHERPSK